MGALKAKDTTDWGPAQKDALRSLVASRQWPQQRLHAAGLADSSLCKLCIDMPGGDQPGTLLHRHSCPALVGNQCMPSWLDCFLRMQGHQLSGTVHLALTRGLFPREVAPVRDQAQFDSFVWPSRRMRSLVAALCSLMALCWTASCLGNVTHWGGRLP